MSTEVKDYANVYKSFEGFEPASREALFFYRLDQLDTTTAFPVLLEVVKRFNSGEHRSELEHVLVDVESFFVRRAVCDLTAKNYNKLVVELLKDLGKGDDFSAASIRKFLVRQEVDTSRWPTDDEFEKAWMSIDFYKRLKRSKGRMILEALEAALYTEKTEKVQVERKLTIEHLLPREWQQHWPLPEADASGDAGKDGQTRNAMLHRVGNLTLLTNKQNPSVSNGPWGRKRKEILRHSALNLNRVLPEEWDEQAIERRSKELFELAVRIWPRA